MSRELQSSPATATPVDLSSVFDEVRVLIEAAYRESQIEIEWRLPDALPLVLGDRYRLFMGAHPFLARAAGVVCGTGNHLEAAIYWGIAARSIHSDSCILGAVHLRCSAIVSGLESAGFKVGEAGWKVLNAYAEDLPTQGDAATARLDTTPAGTPARPSEGKQSMEAEDPTPKHARRGPRSTRDAIRRAARRLKADGKVPGNNGTVPWDVYQKDICRLAGVEWDELSSKPKERGYSLDTIQNALRDMPPSLSINKTTESTEFTEN